MITIFNRKRLITTYDLTVQAKVRAALAVNNVDYYVHPFMFSARPNTQPEFKVYVKKKDYDKAKYLIRDIFR